MEGDADHPLFASRQVIGRVGVRNAKTPSGAGNVFTGVGRYTADNVDIVAPWAQSREKSPVSDPNQPQETEPRQLLRALVERGKENSSDAIMLRLLWLRQEHPEAAITTKALHIENERIVMHAAISFKDGSAGSGIAAASVGDGDDWSDIVERTETIAISRALDTLGYVIRTAMIDRPAPAPSPDPVREIRREEQATPQAVAPPTPLREPSAQPAARPAPTRLDEAAPSVVNALRRVSRPVEPQPSAQEPDPVPSEDDAHLEEYSWNTFWAKARALGLTPEKVTEALGRPANQMSPKEAVDGLVASGAWPQPDGE